LHELVKGYTQALAITGPSDRWARRTGIEGRKTSFPSMCWAKRKSATAHADSQAPNAPPALTFGLPGKQMVKQLKTGRFLISAVRRLPQILKNFTH
jgi:hypothetical protein